MGQWVPNELTNLGQPRYGKTTASRNTRNCGREPAILVDPTSARRRDDTLVFLVYLISLCWVLDRGSQVIIPMAGSATWRKKNRPILGTAHSPCSKSTQIWKSHVFFSWLSYHLWLVQAHLSHIHVEIWLCINPVAGKRVAQRAPKELGRAQVDSKESLQATHLRPWRLPSGWRKSLNPGVYNMIITGVYPTHTTALTYLKILTCFQMGSNFKCYPSVN